MLTCRKVENTQSRIMRERKIRREQPSAPKYAETLKEYPLATEHDRCLPQSQQETI